MRPAVRLLGVRHQHEPHAAGDEREKEAGGIEHQRIVSSAPSTISETPSPSRQFIGSCSATTPHQNQRGGDFLALGAARLAGASIKGGKKGKHKTPAEISPTREENKQKHVLVA